jgi:two-component system response regulator AtoC
LAQETTLDAGLSALSALPTRAYLIVRSGDASEVIDVPDDEELRIGRADDANVRIDDVKASREHAIVRSDNGVLKLRDLGSRNGTRLNTEIVRGEERTLVSGDVLWIGEAEIVVAGDGRPRASTPSASLADSPHIVVADPAMAEVYRLVERVAAQTTTVLLLGETGVGKEVVAELVHRRSGRNGKPFLRVNCGALPETLIESELFGHERGAFTGADKRKVGLFEAGDGGTVFLDEIGELKLELQAKLLRSIETKRFMRVGGTEELSTDVRIIAATNRELDTEVRAGRFRGDLFYRLSIFTISIPPLRDRPNEVVLLAELFARQLAVKMGRPTPRLAPGTRAALERHDWPGNVRELRNVVERAMVLSDDGVLRPEQLPELRSERVGPPGGSMQSKLESVEQKAIEDALVAEGGNQTRAARRLGISRRTLIYRIEKYDLRGKRR